MIYLIALLGIFWIFLLVYDILDKKDIATIYQDILWVTSIVYFMIIRVMAIPILILSIIDIVFIILWGISNYLQNKHNATAAKWMSCFFFVSFIMRIIRG